MELIGTISAMPVAKGTTLDPARTRAAILQAATEALYQHGLDGIGVAELCARIGISKETLYRHFGSKDGLVQAVLEARSDRVVGWLRDAVAAAGDDPAALGQEDAAPHGPKLVEDEPGDSVPRLRMLALGERHDDSSLAPLV